MDDMAKAPDIVQFIITTQTCALVSKLLMATSRLHTNLRHCVKIHNPEMQSKLEFMCIYCVLGLNLPPEQFQLKIIKQQVMKLMQACLYFPSNKCYGLLTLTIKRVLNLFI